MPRRALVVVVALLGVLASTGPASAHTSLVGSSPATGDRLAYSPDEVVLTFASPVNPRTVTATLHAASGATIEVESLAQDAQPTTVVAFATPRLAHDVYGLSWQSVGDDGHRVVGEVLFGVGEAVGATDPIGAARTDAAARALDAAALALRLLSYLLLALAAGLLVTAQVPAIAGEGRGRWPARIARLLGGVTVLRAAVAGLTLLGAGAGPQGLWARGVAGQALVGTGLLLLPHVPWGRMGGRWRSTARLGADGRLAGAVLLVGVVGVTLVGHAVARPDPLVAVTFGIVHLLAAAVWTGPLLVVLLATRRATWTDRPAEERRQTLGEAFAVVGRTAGWALAAVATSGGLLALRSWDGLRGGVLLVLVVKVVVVGAVAVPLGVWHHRTRTRWAGSAPATVRIEVVGLVTALALGGVLVGWDPGWQADGGRVDPAVAAILDGNAADPGACADLAVGHAACLRGSLSTLLATEGPQVAIDTIAQLQATDPYVEANCHQVTHDLGNDAAEQIPDMADALAVDGSICWSGYFHGFIEARLAALDDAELVEGLPTICDGAADPRYSFTHYNCLHGLGHGLMLRADTDLFATLPLCQQAGEFWAVRSCASGAFMENIMAMQQGLDVPGASGDDLLYPCNAVEGELVEDCYMMQTSSILWHLDYDLAAGFGWCDRVEDPHRATCYRSMGRDISSIAALDAQGVVDRCRMGDPDMAQWCIDGAASNAVYEQAGRAAADALCEIVPEEWATACTRSRDQALMTVALG